MSYIYVTEPGAKVGLSGGNIKVTKDGNEIMTAPKQMVEAISIFGNAQMTTQCMRFCLVNGIRVSLFSKVGAYFGCIMSTNHVSITKQKQQFKLVEDKEFALKMAKKLVKAKINNQFVVAKRYLRNKEIDMENVLQQIKLAKSKIDEAENVEQVMGYEGSASRGYFQVLSGIIDEEFQFKGRNKRPPLDPVNAMLSMGYTMLMNEVKGQIEGHGLNPFAGFLHQDRERHPTLASDLMEEWRAIIVDSVILNMFSHKEISADMFNYDEETGACFLSEAAMKVFIKKLEQKLHSPTKYLDQFEGEMTFRTAIWHQVKALEKAIEIGDVDAYNPIVLR